MELVLERTHSLRALKAWPWVADLDGDGKAAVVVPIIARTRRLPYESWGGVELLDGATGAPQWQHRLKLSASSHLCEQLLVGPDIDGDGRRDLFVATTASCQGGRRRGEWTPKDAVFVDALSGKDGHTLWWWQSEDDHYR